MKFSTKIVFLSAIAIAAADETVQLFATSKDGKTISNLGFEPKHEGAGINWIFLDTNSQSFVYDGKSTLALPGGAGSTVGPVPLVFDGPSNYKALQFSVSGTKVSATFAADGTLLLNGGDAQLKACKNIGDSYQYSQAQYAVVQGSPNSDCVDIVVKRSPLAANNSTQNTTSHTSAAPSVVPTAPATPSTPAVVSGAGANSASAGIAILAVGAAAMLL